MQENKKRKCAPSPLSRTPHKRRNEGEMRQIIAQIASGSIAIRTACWKYGLNRNTLKLWMTRLSIRTLADKNSKSMVSSKDDESKEQDYKSKVQQLSKSLEYAKLKILGLETMIKVVEEDMNIKIRKKRGTKQSKE